MEQKCLGWASLHICWVQKLVLGSSSGVLCSPDQHLLSLSQSHLQCVLMSYLACLPVASPIPAFPAWPLIRTSVPFCSHSCSSLLIPPLHDSWLHSNLCVCQLLSIFIFLKHTLALGTPRSEAVINPRNCRPSIPGTMLSFLSTNSSLSQATCFYLNPTCPSHILSHHVMLTKIVSTYVYLG